MINRIHQSIRLLLEQNGAQDITPEEIDIAFNNASFSLFMQLLSTYREANKLPDSLQPFKRNSNIVISNNRASLASLIDLAEILTVGISIGTEEYPAELIRNDSDWLRRSIRDLVPDKDNPDTPFHLFESQSTYTANDFSSALADLPDYFLKAESVSLVTSGGARYPYDLLTSKEFDQKNMVRLIRNKELPKDELFRFLVRHEFTDSDFTNGKAVLPDNFVGAEDFATLISGANEYRWEKGSPEQWSAETISNKIKSGEIADDELFKYLDRVELDASDFTNGKASLPANTIMVGNFATLKTATHEYQWRKATESDWDAKKVMAKINDGLLSEEELSWYNKRLEYTHADFSNGKLKLPDNFVSARERSVYIDASNKEYDWKLADSEEWSGKSLIEKIKKGDLPQDELHWYEQIDTYTGSAINQGAIDLPPNFVSVASVATIVNGKRYEGAILDSDEWDVRQASEVTEEDGRSKPLPQIQVYEDIPLSNSLGNLPDDFNEEIAVAVRDARGNERKVKIISVEEFNNQLDDQVTPATKDYRVCCFLDDKIRVSPGSDLQTIRLYYYQKPNEKCIQLRVVGAKYQIYPKTLSNGVQVEVTSRVFPPKQRSLYRIDGNELQVKSILSEGERFILDCYVYPTSERGLFWSYNETVEVKPALNAGEKLIVPIYRWPTTRHGMFWEYENALEVKPALNAGEKLIVPMYLYPNKYRGQIRIYGSKIQVNPVPAAGESIVMNYLAAITERAARVRIDNQNLHFLPLNMTRNANVYWLKSPDIAKWGYTVSGSDFIYAATNGSNGDTVEAGWGLMAYYDLLRNTILELNLPIKDGFVLQQVGIQERSQLEQQTLDLKGYGKSNA